MSRKPNKVNALKEIESWPTETVVTVLRQELSEVKLNTWRRELGLNGIRTLCQFITDINSKPQDYVTSIPDARLQTKPSNETYRSPSSNVGLKPKQNLPPFQQANSGQWGRPSLGSQGLSNEDNSRGVKARPPPPEPSQPSSAGPRERPMLPPPSNADDSRSRFPPPANKPSNIMNQLERQFGSQRNAEEKPRLPPPAEQSIPPRGISNQWNRPPANQDDTGSNTGYRSRLPPPPEPSENAGNQWTRPPPPEPSENAGNQWTRPPPPKPSENAGNQWARPPPPETSENAGIQWARPPPPEPSENAGNQWAQPPPPEPSESAGNQWARSLQSISTDANGSRFRLPPPEVPQSSEPQVRVNEWVRQLNTQKSEDDFFPPPPEEPAQTWDTSSRPSLPLPGEQKPEENPSWEPAVRARRHSNEDNESWATDWSGEHDVGEYLGDEQFEPAEPSLPNLAAMRNNYDDVNLMEEEVDYMNSETDHQVNALPIPPKPSKPNTVFINKNAASMNKSGATEQQLPVPPGAEAPDLAQLLKDYLRTVPLPPKEENSDDYEIFNSTDDLPPDFRSQFPSPPPAMLPAKPNLHAKTMLPPPPSSMLPPPINERRIIYQYTPPIVPPLPGRPPKVPVRPVPDDDDEMNEYEAVTATVGSSEDDDAYLKPISKGGLPSRPMMPIGAPSRPSKPSIPMFPRKKSLDSTNSSIETPSIPSHFSRQRTPPPKPNKAEPSLGGGSLSRPHRGVPPPSDHHLPPPRGNLSAVGLPAEPWFHKMDRRQADVALKEKGENGCFMIRPSHTTNPYTLSLIYDGQAYHIGVRKRLDGQFALGSEKYNEQKFASVEALVDNYRREHLVLYSHGDRTGCTRLTGTPSRNPANH